MLPIPGNDHRSFSEPPIWLPLFDVQLAPGDVRYLTPSPEAVTADGHEYQPFPIMIQELTDDGKGEITTVQMVVSNIAGTLGSAIKATPGIDSQPVVFKIWSTGQSAVIYEESLEIIKVGPITVESITFELGIFNPFTAKLLQEKYMRDFCWNRYKGRGCWVKWSTGGYAAPAGFTAGSPDSCSRKLADCRRHANVSRFNSFPGIPGNGGFV
jgi:phage-related protein